MILDELKPESEKFKQEIVRRGIDYLIHFTPTINLFSILEHGKIMSRAMLESIDVEQFDILDYVQFTDKVRYDDKNYVNLSISSPNSFLFSEFQKRTKNDLTITWCVLKIDTCLIMDKHTLFSVTNAASKSAKHVYGVSGDYNKFIKLFSTELNIETWNSSRIMKRGNLHPKYPTDIQAEVLIKDEIPIKYISKICFKTDHDLAVSKAAMSELDTSKFCVDPSLFSSQRL